MSGDRVTTLRPWSAADVAAVTARAAALYFRYGSAYSSAVSTVFRGVQLLNTLNGLRSGLTLHSALPSLTTLASNKASEYARNKVAEYARERIATFGMLARVREMSASRLSTSRRALLCRVLRFRLSQAT